MAKKVDKRTSIKVVTSNDFITAKGLDNIPLNSRKLLYLAISQCRKTDNEFFEYEITISDFAALMGIHQNNLYTYAREITGNLISLGIECQLDDTDYDQYSLFSKCSYRSGEGIIRFKLNPDMTKFLLHLSKDFTQPLLSDFIRMKSAYSMAIWHLMQREMKSRKPGVTNVIQFDLDLKELREVTGTQNKLKQIGQFKERCFDKALREIAENCGVNITYENIKKGRTIIGFRCTAIAPFHADENEVDQEVRDRARLGVLRIQSKKRKLTKTEQEEYDLLSTYGEQLELDFNE